MCTGNETSVGSGAHIPVPKNSKLAPFPCYMVALLRIFKIWKFYPFIFRENSPNSGNSSLPQEIINFLKNYPNQIDQHQKLRDWPPLPSLPYRMDLTIMHVLQRGVKPEDHPPRHTVPHYYFLFLSGHSSIDTIHSSLTSQPSMGAGYYLLDVYRQIDS